MLRCLLLANHGLTQKGKENLTGMTASLLVDCKLIKRIIRLVACMITRITDVCHPCDLNIVRKEVKQSRSAVRM